MPQIAVNMKVKPCNKDCSNKKINRFKMRHAAYSNRWYSLEKITYIDENENV